MISEQIQEIIKKAQTEFWAKRPAGFVAEEKIIVARQAKPEFGDYSSPLPLKLAKELKENPLAIAEELVLLVEKIIAADKIEMFSRVEATRPGFLNFYLHQEFIQQQVADVFKTGPKFASKGDKEKIIIEFVSANPTGPIHVGNARGGPWGDTLGNVLARLGHRVYKEYYVNDCGNQVLSLGNSVLKNAEAAYHGDYIDKLNKEIKATDPATTGQQALARIVEEIIKPSMARLGIKYDNYFYESALYQSGEIEQAFDLLRQDDLLYEQDGAWWFRATKFGDEKDRVVKKRDGKVTYFGADIAYHRNKFNRGFDQAINVWGADHHGDMERIRGAMEALGFKDRLKIILTQFVRLTKDGKEYRMSKRKGDYVSIDDLVKEVGKDAVRFFFLMYKAEKHINFDINLAKERSEKNPVYYVQYAHARICSILKKAGNGGIAKDSTPDFSLLKHASELSLIKEIIYYPELLLQAGKHYDVQLIPYYAIELARKFHAFYRDCPVLGADSEQLRQSRLALILATQKILGDALTVLGVDAPRSM